MSDIRQKRYNIMSVENLMATSEEDLFKFEQKGAGLDTNNTLIFEEITRELEAYLARESDADLTDGVFDFLTTLANQVQEEFDEILDGDSNKKRFRRALSKIFTLLLITKVDTAKKIKKILKIGIETVIYNMIRTKFTEKRLPEKMRKLPAWMVNREYDKKKTIYPFKIKQLLPTQKSVNITKNGQLLKTTESKYKFLNLIFQWKKLPNLLISSI